MTGAFLNRLLGHTARIFLATIFIVGCAQSDETRHPERYVIPEDYVGSFHIVFGIQSGEPPLTEDGTRVYQIPDSGVLLTQGGPNPGRTASDNIRFFYDGENDDLHPITGRWTTSLHDTSENRAEEETYVFGGGISEIQPVRHCNIYSKSLYVGTKSQALEQVNYFEIYSDDGIGAIPERVFLGSCNERSTD
ncbi:DUF6843 domain-containing protein [Marinobacter sp. LN3S78]|uniref:DUF6843 domain-containing protein n=1 Tax=Marinobacter sp. LN3S78 TaxID=3382300 RepID=UPI00387B464E